jgi:hypothetical protein
MRNSLNGKYNRAGRKHREISLPSLTESNLISRKASRNEFTTVRRNAERSGARRGGRGVGSCTSLSLPPCPPPPLPFPLSFSFSLAPLSPHRRPACTTHPRAPAGRLVRADGPSVNPHDQPEPPAGGRRPRSGAFAFLCLPSPSPSPSLPPSRRAARPGIPPPVRGPGRIRPSETDTRVSVSASRLG